MRILVTNDDGIDSPGLHVLAQRMAGLGEVTVLAPSGEYSGAGASIGHLSLGLPEVHTVDDHPAMPDAAAVHHLDGPPGLVALLAGRGLFGARPDVVVSGINPGWNVGHAVHASGTIGACLMASACGIPGLAISQRTGGEQRWETAADAAAELVPEAVTRRTVLNVNVDNLAPDAVRGIRWTGLSDRLPYSISGVELSGRTATLERRAEPDRSTDVDTGAVLAGWVSVTELTPTRASDGNGHRPAPGG